MAKAGNKTTTWILLRDALAFVTETYQAPALAERSLLRWLESGWVRWRCLGFEGVKRASDPGEGSREFWPQLVGARRADGSRQIIKVVTVNWAESSAYRKISPFHGYLACRIELAREDLLKILPPIARVPVQTPTSRWIEATFLQMKMTGEIAAFNSDSAIAREIHRQMNAAVRAGELSKVVSVSHIRTVLRQVAACAKKANPQKV
jgi:hypothetical protein